MPICSYQNPTTSKKIKSNNVKLFAYDGNFVAVAGQRDWSLTRAKGTVDVSDKDSGGVSEFIYENQTITASLSGIILQGDTSLAIFTNAIDNECEVLVQRHITLPDGSVSTEEGWALVTSWTETAAYNDVYQYSVELTMNGAFSTIPAEIEVAA